MKMISRSRGASWLLATAATLACATTALASGRLPGDVNNDGRVDAADAVLTLRLALGLVTAVPSQLAAADVDPVLGLRGRSMGDGRVTVDDARRLLRYLAGRIDRDDLAGVVRVVTIAGDRMPGWIDEFGAQARFNFPWTVAADEAGSIYVADTYNGAIRRVDAAGGVNTLAGDRAAPGQVIKSGFRDGRSDRGRFNRPQAVAVGPDGSVFVADTLNHAIRVVQGESVRTVAGNGRPGYQDGVGRAAQFREPTGLAYRNGIVYVADSGNHCVRRIDLDGRVTTLTGSPEPGYRDGPAESARFSDPTGLAFDTDGNLYIADCANARIRRLGLSGQVITYAGSGITGTADGPRESAQFIAPMGLVADDNGNLFVADWEGPTVRRISPDGWVTTVAGAAGAHGMVDGSGSLARFWAPMGIALDRAHHLYVSDTDNQRIRRIDLPRP